MYKPREDGGVPPKHVGLNKELLLFLFYTGGVCFVKASMNSV